MTIELKLILVFLLGLGALVLFGEDVNHFFHGGHPVWEELKSVNWDNVFNL